MDLAELRQRGPKLRQRERALQAQTDALETEAVNAVRYLQLQENSGDVSGTSENGESKPSWSLTASGYSGLSSSKWKSAPTRW